MGFQRDLWNAFHWSKNEPGSWYQISNICGLLDSSEVRAYLPLRPSFIDSLIRPLVTIGFLMVQCKVNEWNMKVFFEKGNFSCRLQRFSGFDTKISPHLHIKPDFDTSLYTTRFSKYSRWKFAFSTNTTKFKEKKFVTSSRSGIKFLVPIQSCQISFEKLIKYWSTTCEENDMTYW